MRLSRTFFSSWIACLILVAWPPISAIARQESDDAVEPVTIELFDGNSLEGWTGDENFWSVADGAIVGQTTESNPTAENTFLICERDDIDDFELELEFRLTGGNSGLQFRSVDLGAFRVSGYQADFDAENRYTGIIYEERGRGILVPRTRHVMIDASGNRRESDEATCDGETFLREFRVGYWNTCRVVAKGSQLTVFVNDTVTSRLDDGETGKARSSGIIALQLHAGPPMKVEFRKVVLTRRP